MLEVNWATEESGTCIAEASFVAADGVNSPTNLLRTREDDLWLAGTAPQHVTLALSPHHPPLHYAGWHVWLDSPTNPRLVEIASGPSIEELTPLLVCEALPGAGTQVWKLPHTIPPQDTRVRFRILESFEPGPTYMNTLVLLEIDPGPDYNANGVTPPTTSVTLSGAEPPYTSSGMSTPYTSRVTLGRREQPSPLPRRVTAPSGPPAPPAGINFSATSRGSRNVDDSARSDVGVFVTTTNPNATTTGNSPRQPNYLQARGRASNTRPPRERSNSRMSQLLRDLDDDIKLLKPIKALSPGKNMLMYLPQERSALQTGSLDASDSETGDRTIADRPQRQGHSASRRGDDEDRNGDSHMPPSSSEAGGSRVDPRFLRPHTQPSPADLALHPAVEAFASHYGPAHEARLNALERAVAALNEAVQHQRDDLTMIKRLLLQQAAERRKESEQRFEDRQRYERMFGVGNGVVALPSPPPPPASAAPIPSPGVSADQRLTHRNITVDFPEDALRVFVESVLEHRMRKHTKKLEAKLLQRLDKQLHDVITVLTATVAGQMANVAGAATSVAGQSISAPHSMYTEHGNALNRSGQVYSPLSQSSFGQGTPNRDRNGDNAPSTPQRGGMTSLMSSKGDVSHTPRLENETGASAFHAVVGGARVRGTS